MKNTLIHKLVYKFHSLGFYYYAVLYDCYDNVRNENIIKCFLRALVVNLKLFNYKYGYYEYLEIPITTKCSLKCRKCSNLIPYYQRPNDYDIDVLKRSIKTFLECINKIVYIRVLGGEPFLSKNLYSIIKLLLDSNKIGRIEIVTNGTIIPNDKKLINILKNKRIIICISEYCFVPYNKLVKFFTENGINYHINKMNFWMDYGNTTKRNKSQKELVRQFANCNHICKSLVNGELHLCPRSSHGTDLGIIRNNQDDYVNLLDDNLSISDKKREINKLFKKKWIYACDYCDYGTKNSKKIPVAEQIKKK